MCSTRRSRKLASRRFFTPGKPASAPACRAARVSGWKYSNPMFVDDVAVDFPGKCRSSSRIRLSPGRRKHCRWPQHKPNVYIDLSGWSPKYFPPSLVKYANTLLKHKVLFGSDWPVIRPDRWLSDFDNLDIKPDVRPLILKGENAIKLLGLAEAKASERWVKLRLDWGSVALKTLGSATTQPGLRPFASVDGTISIFAPGESRGVAWIRLSRVIIPADSEETMVAPARAAGTVGFLQLCFDYGCGAAARLRREVQQRFARVDRYDAVAAVLFGALIVLVAYTRFATTRSPTTKRCSSAILPKLIVAYYRSGFVDQSVFHFRNLLSLWRLVRSRRPWLAKSAPA